MEVLNKTTSNTNDKWRKLSLKCSKYICFLISWIITLVKIFTYDTGVLPLLLVRLPQTSLARLKRFLAASSRSLSSSLAFPYMAWPIASDSTWKRTDIIDTECFVNCTVRLQTGRPGGRSLPDNFHTFMLLLYRGCGRSEFEWSKVRFEWR